MYTAEKQLITILYYLLSKMNATDIYENFTPSIICDLDGVLVDERKVRKRFTVTLHSGEKKVVDWDGYFMALWEWELITTALPILNAPMIHFFTARNEICRDITTEWIDTHLPHIQNYTLHMRKTWDKSNGTDVKERFLSEIDTSKVLYAIDDDGYTCQMYRNHWLNFFHTHFYN